MDIDVLTKDEERVFGDVKTTPKQARQMIKRFKLMLNAFETGAGVYDGDIGCPHCGGVCNACAYVIPPFIGFPDTCFGARYCLRATFGGVNYRMVSDVIGLCSDGETVYQSVQDLRRDLQYVLIGDVRKFFLGHIQWAVIVLRKAKKKSTFDYEGNV